MFSLFIILPVLLSTVLSTPSADDLLITLPDGKIRGVEYVTENNKSYYAFQGIPFATPPVGELRFQAPKPPEPWSGILDGAKEGNACMAAGSIFFVPENHSEDCLYINVYTPSLKPPEKLPILFWIYGGAYISGSSNRAMNGPDYIIEEDVILVTHNYRVGSFGFLSTGDEVIRGNAGLKDQALALKWVRNNIALFGGDPDKVTIFGQSAGGQSTGLQMMSKLSTGLFRAAVVQSGSVLTNSSASLDQRSYAFLLASQFPGGDYGNDTQKLREFLLNKTAKELVDAADSLTDEDVHAWPTIEVEGEEAFITESPFVLLESGNFNKVPIMIGVAAEESLLFIPDLAFAQNLALMLDTDLKKVIPSDLRPDSKDVDAAVKKIRRLYLRDDATFSTNLTALAEYISDNKFARALVKHAELQSHHVPVYLYQFAYYGRAMSKPFIDGIEKATHSAELPFLFNMNSTGFFNDSTVDDLLTQKRTVKLWTNFAKYLNPTPEKSELLNNVIWPTVSPSNLNYLNINNTLEVRENFKENTYLGWNETFYNYGKKPFVTF